MLTSQDYMDAEFDSRFVLNQIESANIMGVAQVSREGYEFSERADLFIERFWPITVRSQARRAMRIQDLAMT